MPVLDHESTRSILQIKELLLFHFFGRKHNHFSLKIYKKMGDYIYYNEIKRDTDISGCYLFT